MRVSMDIKNKLTMVAEMENDSTFQVLEYDELEGARDIETCKFMYHINRSGMTLKQPRIILENSAVRLQQGALNYMKGHIEINNKENGFMARGKKFLASKLVGETGEKPLLRGTGDIFLEPTFGYFTLIELEDDEIIIDDGLFYACEESIEITSEIQSNIAATISGDEGICQLTLSGSGIVLLEIPVPETEIFRCKIYEDILKIDGEFAILRSEGINYTVEKSGTSLIGRPFDGEGYLNVYEGTGEVWLIPTNEIYKQLSGRRDGE